jgi:hypothetical protein
MYYKGKMMTDDDHYKTKIAEYKAKRNSSCQTDAVVQYVLEQKEIDDVIKKAVMSKDKHGNKHSHQWRIYNYVYDEFIPNIKIFSHMIIKNHYQEKMLLVKNSVVSGTHR